MGNNGDASVLQEMLKLIEKKFDEKFEVLLGKIQESNSNLGAELHQATSAVEILKKENQEQKERISFLEKRLRKNNVVIFGTHCQDNNLLADTIINLNTLLNINLGETDIANIYRPKTQGKPPIILEFTRNLTKARVFEGIRQNSTKLKEAKVLIKHDLTKEEREVQKFLREKLGQARKQNKTAKITGTSLLVDGVKFSYQFLKSKEIENERKEELESDLESLYDSGKEDKILLEGGPKRKIAQSPSILRTTRQTQKKKKDNY